MYPTPEPICPSSGSAKDAPDDEQFTREGTGIPGSPATGSGVNSSPATERVDEGERAILPEAEKGKQVVGTTNENAENKSTGDEQADVTGEEEEDAWPSHTPQGRS